MWKANSKTKKRTQDELKAIARSIPQLFFCCAAARLRYARLQRAIIINREVRSIAEWMVVK
jgi:hypothetical protein